MDDFYGPWPKDYGINVDEASFNITAPSEMPRNVDNPSSRQIFADGCYPFALSIATRPTPANAASLLFDDAGVYFVGDSGE
jgi:hypothetical protein